MDIRKLFAKAAAKPGVEAAAVKPSEVERDPTPTKKKATPSKGKAAAGARPDDASVRHAAPSRQERQAASAPKGHEKRFSLALSDCPVCAQWGTPSSSMTLTTRFRS